MAWEHRHTEDYKKQTSSFQLLPATYFPYLSWMCSTLYHTASHFDILQHTATHCDTLQHTATHCGRLYHTVPHCNRLQQTATDSNRQQHTATHCNRWHHTATHCNTLQHTAAHCSTLQHTATHCNTLHDLPSLTCRGWRMNAHTCIYVQHSETFEQINFVVGNRGSVAESDFYTKLKKLDVQEGGNLS